MTGYTSEDKDGAHVIKCPHIIDLSPGMDAVVKGWLEKPATVHIIDLAGVVEFREKAYRPFVLLNQALKSAGKKLFVMNATSALTKQFAAGGLASTFPAVSSVAEALAKGKPQAAKPVVDVEFISPFVTATQKVLSTQCNITLEGGKIYIKKSGEQLPMEIAGVISLSNPKFTGSISLCFRAEVFLKIYESMVGEKHEKITHELEDAAGELLNMIFGQAKTILNDQKGHSLEKALPTIMTGEKLTLRHHGSSPVIILPFESSAGSFHIEVSAENS